MIINNLAKQTELYGMLRRIAAANRVTNDVTWARGRLERLRSEPLTDEDANAIAVAHDIVYPIDRMARSDEQEPQSKRVRAARTPWIP